MRRGQIFWGVIAIAAGVILLLQTMGILTTAFWPVFWAVLLILAGVWFLAGPSLFRGSAREERLDLPLSGAKEAEVSLEHGAGRLEVHALELSGSLLEGTFGGGVEHNLALEQSKARLRVKSAHDVFMIPGVGFNERLDWNLGLTREIPLKLVVQTGASENQLDLSQLRLEALRFETGASSSRITLPANAGFTQAEIGSGAASVEITIPDGVAASITIESGLADIKIDEQRFVQSGHGRYRSADFDTAANRVELLVKTGVGSVRIR